MASEVSPQPAHLPEIAVVLGAVSISLAARYGYKGADTTIDGVISAVVFGAIALGPGIVMIPVAKWSDGTLDSTEAH